MGELLKLCLTIYVITLIFSIVIATVKFIIDTFRWHDREERTEVFASNFEKELEEEPIESEVNEIDTDE